MSAVPLAEVNALDQARFTSLLGAVFEHSPWVAEAAWRARPFSTVDALHAAMVGAVREAGRERQLALIRAHPELSGREAAQGSLTADSTSEQGRLGLLSLTKAEFDRMGELNRRYREKFGFPCIVALRLHATRESVMQEMAHRAANDAGAELDNALGQIAHITRGRLDRLVA